MKNMSDCVYPCPCGYYGDSLKPCTCAPVMVRNIKNESLVHCWIALTSTLKFHVRFSKIESSNIVANADMRVGEIGQFCRLKEEGQGLIRAAKSQRNLSACAYHRILKLARTIADLAGSEEIQSAHLVEALQYRPKIMVG